MRLTNNLFIRVFIWFWGLLTLVTAVNILVLLLMDTRTIRHERIERDVRALQLYGSLILDLHETGKTDVLKETAKVFATSFNMELFLMNHRGNVLFGENLSQAAMTQVAKVMQGGDFQTLETEKGHWLFTRIEDSDGRSGVAAGKKLEHHLLPPPFRPRALGSRFLIGVALSGILAWFFAGSLAKPIVRLKESTRQLADGDLEVRSPSTISRRKDEIGELGREFDVMAGRLQELLASRDRLLRDISHELRSPLARLGVALELVYQKATPEAETSLDRIRRESEKLNNLIGQLLTLSSIQGGVDLQRTSTFKLDAVIQEIAADAGFEAHNKNRGVRIIKIEPVTMSGHEDLVHQAVENVVRNGLANTQEKTDVEITLQKMEMHGTVRAVILVQDHGPGVPDHLLGSIFQPFFRVSEARERATGGAGVGLAITQRAIQVHGGTVEASNAPEGGFMVEITLPV